MGYHRTTSGLLYMLDKSEQEQPQVSRLILILSTVYRRRGACDVVPSAVDFGQKLLGSRTLARTVHSDR
jgi:hypothetical protein